MNTIRVYETPASVAFLAVALALAGLIVGLFLDDVIYLSSTQYTGLCIADAIAVGLATVAAHRWAWGRKLRLEPTR